MYNQNLLKIWKRKLKDRSHLLIVNAKVLAFIEEESPSRAKSYPFGISAHSG